MHTLQRSESSAQDNPRPTWEYRAATIEEAVEAAADDLGPDIEIVTANRIRRGGVGGFFATDLGVEVVVARLERGTRSIPRGRGAGGDALQAFLDAETDTDGAADAVSVANDGLDRLLADVERDEWVANHTTPATGSDDVSTPADRPPATASFARHLERQFALDPAHDDAEPVWTDLPRRRKTEPTVEALPVRSVESTENDRSASDEVAAARPGRRSSDTWNERVLRAQLDPQATMPRRRTATPGSVAHETSAATPIEAAAYLTGSDTEVGSAATIATGPTSSRTVEDELADSTGPQATRSPADLPMDDTSMDDTLPHGMIATTSTDIVPRSAIATLPPLESVAADTAGRLVDHMARLGTNGADQVHRVDVTITTPGGGTVTVAAHLGGPSA